MWGVAFLILPFALVSLGKSAINGVFYHPVAKNVFYKK